MGSTSDAAPAATTGPVRSAATLVLAGAALATTQLLAVRELVSGLFGEEVVLLLVNVTLFAAISCGYWLAPRMRRLGRAAEIAFVVGCLLHLSLPVLPRLGFAWLAARRWNGAAPLAMAIGVAVALLAPLSTLLPRAVASYADPVEGMRRSYSAELAGFLLGLGLTHLCFGHGVEVLVALHWSLLALVAGLALGARAFAVVALPAALLWPSLPARAHAASNAVYREVHGMRSANVVFSVDSPYQRVEVVDSGPGRRSLYLDGLENLNANDLALLNEYLAVVPARIARPASTLVIGNGTLSLVAPLAALSNELLTVEIDPVVVAAGERFFSPGAGRANLAWRLVQDDGKSFLAGTSRSFDLIVIDVPSPLTFQEAFLHTREFYALVRSRLTPRGVVTVQLSGHRLGAIARSPSRVAAALAAELPDLMVVESGVADRAFAYASRELPFGADDVRAAAPPSETHLVVRDAEAVRARTRGAQPLDIDSLDLVLRRGFERLVDRRGSGGAGD
ncbi:MAG: hypothetical protein KIS78_34310 [Labilithrix sp.]|nr:hypothetical protein [Labilithrix sp.]